MSEASERTIVRSERKRSIRVSAKIRFRGNMREESSLADAIAADAVYRSSGRNAQTGTLFHWTTYDHSEYERMQTCVGHEQNEMSSCTLARAPGGNNTEV